MQYIGGVFATDGRNRDDTYLTVSALADALWNGWMFGMPTHLSHDMLRLVGWNRPVAVYLEPGLSRLMGMGELPETDQERQQLNEWMREAQARQFSRCTNEINELRDLLKSHTSTEAKHICLGCGGVALFEENLATRVFPEIFKISEADKDGLVPLSQLNPIDDGVYQIGDLILFAHPFLRRSFSRFNNLNTPFLERLQGLVTEGIEAKVALDPSLVGLASTYAPPLEFEYWWGPRFDDDLTKIVPGVTRHRGTKIDRMLYGIAHTDFWWHSRDSLHTLEAEELRDEEIKTEEVQGYFCRYVHSMVDKSTGNVTHFDGAVRGYSDEAMLQRVSVDIKNAGRNSDYTKLWRLDAPISIATWKGLLSDYFRDNRLVGEYLGTEPEPPTLADKTHASDSSTGNGEQDAIRAFDLKDYVPHSPSILQGLHLALTYHSSRMSEGAARQAIPLHAIKNDGEETGVFERPTIELGKALKRLGQQLAISNISVVMHPKDMHVDFGVIGHRGNEDSVAELIAGTLEGIKNLVDVWAEEDNVGTVAYAVAFPIEEREAQLSFIGSCSQIKEWLANPLSTFPVTREGLEEWLEKVAKFLKQRYSGEGAEAPLLNQFLPFTGSLMQRKRVERIDFEANDNGLKWKMLSTDIQKVPGLSEAMKQGIVMPTPLFVVNEAECSQCHESYYTCDCSTVLDKEGSLEIKNVSSIDGIWSDRNALVGQKSATLPG